nr:hypothetical protein [Tanacetum cinerariifolium]
LQSVEEKLLHYKKNEAVLTDKINVLNIDVKLRDKVLADYTKNLEQAEKERDELKLTLEKLQDSPKALNNLLDSQVSDKSKVGNYMPPKHDLRLTDEHFETVYVNVISNIAPSDVKTVESKHKTVDVNHNGVFSTEEPKPVMKNKFSPPIIEDWHSDDEILDLEKAKTAQAKEIVDLKKRVKKLERKRRYRTLGMNLFKIGTSRRKSLGEDDASKQERNLKQRDKILDDYTKNLEQAKKERDELNLTLKKLQNSSKALNNLLDSQVNDKSKDGLRYKEITPDSFVNSSKILEKQENRPDKEYHAVLPSLTGNYMPLKRDLRLIDEHFESVSVDVISNIAPSDVKTVESKRKTVDVNHRANVVPPKKPTSHLAETQKPELKVYNRKPKNVKNVGSSNKAKIIESKTANHSEPNHTWGSNATDIPSSSSIVMTGCPDCSLVSGLRMFETHDREPLSAHELFPVAVAPRAADLADSHVSTSINQDAPSTSIPSTQEQEHSSIISQGFEELPKRFDYIDVQGSKKARLKLKELMELCTKLSDKVLDLEKTKTAQAKEIADLKKRVKKLERKRRSRTPGMNLFKIDSYVSDKSKAGLGYKEITLDSFVNSSKILEKQENRSDKEYHSVLPPLTGNYMPPKRDLKLIDEHFESVSIDVIFNIAHSDVKTVESNHKTVDVNHKGAFGTEKPKPVMKNNFSPPIIGKNMFLTKALTAVLTASWTAALTILMKNSSIIRLKHCSNKELNANSGNSHLFTFTVFRSRWKMIAVAGILDGGVLLLENVRFYKKEEKNDPAYAKKLVSLADFPNKLFAAIVGGSKVSSEIGVIVSLSRKWKKISLTLQHHFLKGKSKGVSLVLSSDVVIADKFTTDANSKVVPAKEIPDRWMGLDIGPDSIKSFSETLDTTKTIIWNGPMCVFEMEKLAAETESCVLISTISLLSLHYYPKGWLSVGMGKHCNASSFKGSVAAGASIQYGYISAKSAYGQVSTSFGSGLFSYASGLDSMSIVYCQDAGTGLWECNKVS